MAPTPLTNTSTFHLRYRALRRVFLFLRVSYAVCRSTQSYTITDVTLKVGTGYNVQFVSPTNQSNVYANSTSFEVKAPGSKFFHGSRS